MKTWSDSWNLFRSPKREETSNEIALIKIHLVERILKKFYRVDTKDQELTKTIKCKETASD